MNASKTIITVVLGLAVALVMLMIVAWAFRWGPFGRPSAAARLQPRIEKSVGKTEAEVAAATGHAATTTETAAAKTEKDVQNGVAEIHRSGVEYRDRMVNVPGPVRVVVGDYPDGPLYRGLCRLQHYSGDPACGPYRDQQPSAGPRRRP